MKRFAFALLLATAVGCGGNDDDTPIDPPDPTPETCNLNTQEGCAAGEKCTWIRQTVGEEPVGKLGCVPDGNVASGGECQWGVAGSATGYDNCAAGLVCASSSSVDEASGTCTEICSLDAISLPCPTGFSCSRYHGYFANEDETPAHGQCNASCDPLTNKSFNAESGEYDIDNCGGELYPDVYPEGHPQAGQPVPEAGLPQESCVTSWARDGGAPSAASCASNLNPLYGHRDPPALAAADRFLNSCPPGTHIFSRGEGTEDATCLALCVPADTYMGSSAQGRGVAPNSCDDALPWISGGTGRAANDAQAECRFAWWMFEAGDNLGLSPLSNGLGACFDASKYLLSDGVTPVPRCDSLTDEIDAESGVATYILYGCGAIPTEEKAGVQSKAKRVGPRVQPTGAGLIPAIR